MLRAKTRWKLAAANEEIQRKGQILARELDIPPLMGHLLAARGLKDKQEAEQFLQPSSGHFHDPLLMSGMEQAVSRIRQAIADGENILIYGDYDADGVSSTSIMIHTLQRLGAEFSYYIPNRFHEGYGLNKPALQLAKEHDVSLIITVDTGITAVEEVEFAKELGMEMIITDHHQPPSIIPNAYTVINPQQVHCQYPFSMLAGAGVAFKLAHALLGELPRDLLGYAAIGTISDLVPLVGENRLIAKMGLETLNHTRHPGIRALLEASGLSGKEITAEHVGFAVGPRINASGRLDSADRAVELLICEDSIRARGMAEELDKLNKERQSAVQQIAQEAEEMVEEQMRLAGQAEDVPTFLVVANEGWNEGVIGIVASRLVEKYYRPTVVLSIDLEKGVAKGSARSIEGFDIYRSLSECAHLFTHFGGHTMAAGMSLPVEAIDELRREMNRIASRLLKEEDFIPVTYVDAICAPEEITLDVIGQLERLAPFGTGNPSPLFMVKGVALSQSRIIGKDLNHLKCILSDGNVGVDGVGFNMAEAASSLSTHARADVIGELAVNEWNGHRKPQMIMRDLAVPHPQIFDWRENKNRVDKLAELAAKELCTVFFFHKQTGQELEPFLFANASLSACHVLSSGEWHFLNSERDQVKKTIILYDLPDSLAMFESLLQKLKGTERVYCLFGAKGDSTLQPLPKREQFKWLYGVLYKYRTIAATQAVRLSGGRGLTADAVSLMLDVFEELGFVKKDGIKYHLSENPQKRDLADSRLYQRRKQEEELKIEFFYSSSRVLCDWILSVLTTEQHRNSKEEAGYEL